MDAYSTSFLRQRMMAMDDYSTSSLRRWMKEEEDDDFFFLFDDDDEAEIATYNLLVESERSTRRRRSDAPPKIRPIDKKAEYRIQKLTNAADNATAREKAGNAEAKAKDEHSDEEDPMKYRPNPDMMDTKSGLDEQDTDGVYRPPKFMPTSMDDEEKGCKKDSRRDKAMARVAVANPYIKEIIHDVADRPEEWKETVGDESREFGRYMRQREEQERQEVELFTRAPITKRDKQIEKRIRRQLHGLGGLTRDREDDGSSSKSHGKSGNQKKHLKSSKKRKRGISLEHTGKA